LIKNIEINGIRLNNIYNIKELIFKEKQTTEDVIRGTVS